MVPPPPRTELGPAPRRLLSRASPVHLQHLDLSHGPAPVEVLCSWLLDEACSARSLALFGSIPQEGSPLANGEISLWDATDAWAGSPSAGTTLEGRPLDWMLGEDLQYEESCIRLRDRLRTARPELVIGMWPPPARCPEGPLRARKEGRAEKASYASLAFRRYVYGDRQRLLATGPAADTCGGMGFDARYGQQALQDDRSFQKQRSAAQAEALFEQLNLLNSGGSAMRDAGVLS